MTKPSLFIGSSTEGLPFARGVRASLNADVEVSLWNEGFFKPGNTFIDTLITSLPRFDFAVLVLTPDDLTSSRDAEHMSPRDNVIFELGLFMGRLGKRRTFLFHQKDADLKIPSDLAGLTAATYQWPREDHSHVAAVGSACDEIRKVIVDLGVTPRKNARALEGLTSRQDHQERQLSSHDAKIRSLQVALRGIVTDYERQKLTGLAAAQPFLCDYSDEMYNELKHLRAMGFIHLEKDMNLRRLRDQHKASRRLDLKEYVYLSEPGSEYLNLLQKSESH